MANGLLDFLQGASNSAAANVSAPVDGLTWLLNKLGADIKTPVGGTDWMRERGLTAEPTNKLAGILGESVGGVLPMVTAAKAPQIAQGLLQAERNLAVPRTLNPQTGAILWQGSPHKFDAFDSSKIGTGEGAQAYGHGMYLADNPTVAKEYQRALAGSENGTAGQTAARMLQMYKDPESAASVLSADLSLNLTAEARKHTLEAIDLLKTGKANTGYLYKVDLPDEHIAKMLDWDKPLSQQHPDVQTAFGGKLTPEGLKADPPGSALYNSLIGNWDKQSVASDQLFNAGIPGIRYLDGGSRGTGAGTSNYVVFPGNEGLLSILERNGQPLK